MSSLWSNISSNLVEDSLRLVAWDEGLVTQSIAQNKLWPRALSADAKRDALGWIVPKTAPQNKLSEGTFHGTSRALTQVFDLIQTRFNSYFDVINLQPSLPQGITTPEEKRRLYQWSPGPDSGPDYDHYPPHLSLIPKGSKDDFTQAQIFDRMRLLDSGFVLASIIPDKIKDFVYGYPDQGATIAQIEQRNHDLRSAKKDIYAEPNVGDRKDWYTDEMFAQQSFTGNNPTTIELAKDWIDKFKTVAKEQNNKKMVQLLTNTDNASLYVQDCSHIREAVGATADTKLWVQGKVKGEDRFACASVTLYRLEPKGKLHPLAIVIDFKGNMEKSVVIFNQRLHSSDKGDQQTDWPWRYAKTAAQASDWIRHEVGVHLNDCHLVEEAVIVAAYRTLPEDHIVYRLLYPHWLKTLAINAGARSTLVPHVVCDIIGITPEQTYSYLRDSYKNFKWEEHYVPKDLERRGFPVSQINDEKFHNYAYARDIQIMWFVLHKFVLAYLQNGSNGYKSDEDVANDQHIRDWCDELRSDNGGQLKSFPDIKTLNELVDTVTMCIHIASPQHTAINYLQEYYQSFVINKPPSLSCPPPQSIDELKKYTEKDLMAALPINRPTEWLLASHIPYLLSYRVAENQNLVTYAISQYHLADENGEDGIKEASRKLVMDLRSLGDAKDEKGNRVKGIFSKISDEMDEGFVEYKVMEPIATAVSILI
ncbi:Lipoxygenase [Rhizodiscina lignyota]|uniref:Manganese lipoxygenase n=1 Tax=Rhizodiscina lignyota TaxID=1504668 RepID=A0A9P4M500_9PEZI|nr:Lipoxygenase [Rhizodiscina lignyota]